MKAVHFLWLVISSALVSMPEARLGFSVRRSTKAQQSIYYYHLTLPSAIYNHTSEDLRVGRDVWALLTPEELRNMTGGLLKLLPKTPITPTVLILGFRSKDIVITNLEVPIGKFKVLQVKNYRWERGYNSFDLSFTVPKFDVTFSSDNCQRLAEGRVHCSVIFMFENIKVDLSSRWTRSRVRTIFRADILKFEPGSIKAQFSSGITAYPDMIILKKSHFWSWVMDVAKSYIPANSQFDRLMQTFATAIFA